MTTTATAHPQVPDAATPAPTPTAGPSAGPSVAPASVPTREQRQRVVARVREVLDASGLRWAWQGERDAVDRWIRARDAKDLDVWVEDPGAGTGDVAGTGHTGQAVLADLDAALGARVAHADDPRRLRHASWAVETMAGLAVVDLTVGDLAVGTVLLLDQRDVALADEPGPHGPRLAGAAAVADLVLRRLLRGGTPSQERIAEARDALQHSDINECARVGQMLRRVLDDDGDTVLAALRGAPLPRGTARRVRRRLALRTLLQGLPAALRQWRSVVPAGPLAGPLGLRRRGTVVVLVGTDGSGKSTIAAELTQRLARAGLPTSSAYFGMAHGNLPGVALARRLLGVAPAGDAHASGRGPSTGDGRPTEGARPGGEPGHARVRRAAAWFYAAEYVWRWATTVAPHVARGRVVVVDRWVWDLRESPWPGSRASAWLERVVPRPDVVALGDAPASVIHARKPERSEADQARQQALFHGILATRPARCAEVVVDTSGTTADPCAGLVASVVGAAHLPRRQDGGHQA